MWVFSAQTGVGNPLAPDQVFDDRASSSRRWRSGWSRGSISSWAGTSLGQGRDGAWNPTAGVGPEAQVMVVQHSADRGGPGPQAARP